MGVHWRVGVADLVPIRLINRGVPLIIVVLLANLSSSFLVHASPGDLDPTFGEGGKVTTDFFGLNEEAFQVVVQEDGKILVAGVAFNPDTANDFAITRYTADGSLDTSFGKAGKASVDFAQSNDRSYSLAIQNDGKIVVAGTVFNPTSFSEDFALARFNSDGSLDKSFGHKGRVTTDFFAFTDHAFKVVLQADGKIVVGGTATQPGVGSLLAVARYNGDGTLDAGFGIGGKATNNFSDPRGYDVALEETFDLRIQPDGKIVTAGYTLGFPSFYDFIVVRHNPDGTLDSRFGSGGKAITDFHGFADLAFGVAIQPDGKVIAAGYTNNIINNSDFGLVRYNPDGSLDTSFGVAGRVETDFAGTNDLAYRIAIQRDGRIIVIGKSYSSLNYDFAVARYNIDGSLDPSFGNGGRVITDFFGGVDEANEVVIQRNGRILVVGRTAVRADVFDFALARYQSASLRITGATVAGKKLIVTGEGFDFGSKVLLNGEVQRTANNDEAPAEQLIAKKSGKRVQIGDTLQVQNPDGSRSQEFIFTGF